jgi:hypothetical protein
MRRKTPLDPDDIEKIYDQIEGENDRAAIIVAGAWLETSLEMMIRSHLRAPTKTEQPFLFGEKGIAGTFSDKIWLAYFMKLIGPSTKRDLDLIRNIRNDAAHEFLPVSFAHETIAGRCRAIEFSKTLKGQPDLSLRRAFLATIKFLTAALVARAAFVPRVADRGTELEELMARYTACLDR